MTGSRSVSRIAVAFVVTAAFIPVKHVRAEGFDDYTAPRNATVDTRGARSVEVRAAAGSLRIEGKTGISQVQIRGTARASSRRRLDDIKLIAERRGDVVFIKADMPDDNNHSWRDNWNDNSQLDLVIEVPQSLSLDVEDGSGDTKIYNVGPLTMEDGSGELEIKGVKGDLSVTDGSGSMTLENIEGHVRVSDGSGEIVARNVTGNFTVEEDGSGEIAVNGVGGDFVVEQKGSGSISSSGVRGKIDIPDRHRRRSRGDF